jgi:hypothetical protein
MSNREAAAASERPLPPLPHPAAPTHFKGPLFTAEQMHAYVLADRAASAPQAVRMLTTKELESVITSQMKVTYYAADLIQRKFCEVNGIVPLAPQDSTKEGTTP